MSLETDIDEPAIVLSASPSFRKSPASENMRHLMDRKDLIRNLALQFIDSWSKIIVNNSNVNEEIRRVIGPNHKNSQKCTEYLKNAQDLISTLEQEMEWFRNTPISF